MIVFYVMISMIVHYVMMILHYVMMILHYIMVVLHYVMMIIILYHDTVIFSLTVTGSDPKKLRQGQGGGDILWRMFSKFIHRNLKQTYKYFSLDFFFKFYIKPGVAKRPVHMHADLIAYVAINRKINHNFINLTTFKLTKNNSLQLNESRSILHF